MRVSLSTMRKILNRADIFIGRVIFFGGDKIFERAIFFGGGNNGGGDSGKNNFNTLRYLHVHTKITNRITLLFNIHGVIYLQLSTK